MRPVPFESQILRIPDEMPAEGRPSVIPAELRPAVVSPQAAAQRLSSLADGCESNNDRKPFVATFYPPRAPKGQGFELGGCAADMPQSRA